MAKHRAARKGFKDLRLITFLKGQWRNFFHAWDDLAEGWFERSREDKQ